MSDRSPYDSQLRAEQLYRAAEIRAVDTVSSQDQLPADFSDAPSNSRLANLAYRELERRDVRSRYLPADLGHDTGWSILLDILICDFQAKPIKVTDSASRWKLSEATAARQIAGLIEVGMITRVLGQNADETAILRLTNYGREVLQRILTLLD
ncbi:hypothetical protein J3454_15610 [Erythrobacter sp. NFXS35]|uniref:hypothetical protein n=1 Tax=Erythrobacter sp. NFXS35 TaxID=2818436 RepID=UPI0032DF4389